MSLLDTLHILGIKSKHYEWKVVKMAIRKGRKGKHWTKDPGKKCQIKEKDEKISYNFYLQVLMLVITEIRTQLLDY